MSNPLKAPIVTAIVIYIFKKSTMKLAIQYAFSCMPDDSYKCLRPAFLSTTRYETTVVNMTL